MTNTSSCISTTLQCTVEQVQCCGSQRINKVQLSTDILVSAKSPHFQIPLSPKSSPSFTSPQAPSVRSHTDHQVPSTCPHLRSSSNAQFVRSQPRIPPADTLGGSGDGKMKQEVPARCWANRYQSSVGRVSKSTTKDNCCDCI